MYKELVDALSRCTANMPCKGCYKHGCIGCSSELMSDARAAIQQLQNKMTQMIDLDADPDVFMKTMKSSGCKNGTEYIDMFCMGYDDEVYAVDIRDEVDLRLLRAYFENHSGKTFGETIKDDYIGKRVIVNFWDGDGCNVIGTREEMETKFKSYLDELFGTETEGKNEN